MGLLGKVQGFTDDDRHPFFIAILGHEITSQSQITAEEAGWLIQTLVAAEKAGDLGVLVHAALGRPMPDPDPFAGLPDPSTDEQGWHDREHPVWRRAQLDTEKRSTECTVCLTGRTTAETVAAERAAENSGATPPVPGYGHDGE